MAGAVHSLWMNPLRLFGTVYELPGNCDGRQDRLVCNQVLIMNKTVGGAAVDGAYRIIYCSEEQIPSCFLRLQRAAENGVNDKGDHGSYFQAHGKTENFGFCRKSRHWQAKS